MFITYLLVLHAFYYCHALIRDLCIHVCVSLRGCWLTYIHAGNTTSSQELLHALELQFQISTRKMCMHITVMRQYKFVRIRWCFFQTKTSLKCMTSSFWNEIFMNGAFPQEVCSSILYDFAKDPGVPSNCAVLQNVEANLVEANRVHCSRVVINWKTTIHMTWP